MAGWKFDVWIWSGSPVERPAGAGRRPSRNAWPPAVDILETSDSFWIYLAVPGVEPSAIEIVLDGTLVGISGFRKCPPIYRAASVRRLELARGPFERWIELPPGAYSLEEKEIQHGCLLLRLKKLSSLG